MAKQQCEELRLGSSTTQQIGECSPRTMKECSEGPHRCSRPLARRFVRSQTETLATIVVCVSDEG